MKILAIVLTYYPEKDVLIKNVTSFADYVDKIILWENTPEKDKNDYRFVNRENVEYCGNGINSISIALNYALRYANENGYDYLLTMDQDSVWENFGDYINKTIYNASAPLGLYGPCINGESYEEDFHPKELITSGMLAPICVLNKIGGYNELFTIDGIDSWLCCIAKELGYGSYVVCGCNLKQQFGKLHQSSFLWFSFLTLDYPAWRLYEVYKSYVIILRRFKGTVNLKKHFWRNLMGKDLIKIILVEQEKIKKLNYIIRGIKDGLIYNFNNE